VPAALEQQAALGGRCRLLFVAPAHSLEEVLAFADERGWLETEALWTVETPLEPTTRYPALALLSPSGEVLLEGSAPALEEAVRARLAHGA